MKIHQDEEIYFVPMSLLFCTKMAFYFVCNIKIPVFISDH